MIYIRYGYRWKWELGIWPMEVKTDIGCLTCAQDIREVRVCNMEYRERKEYLIKLVFRNVLVVIYLYNP